jgi:hypothetical protein
MMIRRRAFGETHRSIDEGEAPDSAEYDDDADIASCDGCATRSNAIELA